MVVGTARPGPLHLVHNPGWAQPWPQVTRSSLGTLPMRGRENCWEVWPGENVRSSGGRKGFRFPGHLPREPGNLPGYSRVGMLHRGRLVVEGPGCACGVPSLGPKLASPGSDKSHLLGASPLFFYP